MDKILDFTRAHQKATIALIRELVECESPSEDKAALGRMRDLIVGRLTDLGKVRKVRGGHLHCQFDLPGPRKKDGQILALGHYDTVWPMGTLAKMPFRKRAGRLHGPGIFDMKSGIAFFISAMTTLRELDLPVSRRVVMRLVSDEEIGSATSRDGTEREARRSIAALVMEPALGLDGNLKTARKGVGDYKVTVHGKASHSGIDFASGASAVVELAKQIEQIAKLTNLKRGVTLNPGILGGGGKLNVVADKAWVELDLRVTRQRDGDAVDRKLHALKPFDKRCRLEITGGLNRPPMERTVGVARLFRLARKLAAEMGVEQGEAATGGASDGNLTAALGIPTLDGLGGVGEGAHAPHESILVDRIADRVALLGKLVRSI
ncbi:MAG: M20 family metallopeptidase [bacterium]|nr:M20 family metallopeptidase [bacterium]